MAACCQEASAALHMFVLFVHWACVHSQGSRSSREAGEPRSQVEATQDYHSLNGSSTQIQQSLNGRCRTSTHASQHDQEHSKIMVMTVVDYVIDYF